MIGGIVLITACITFEFVDLANAISINDDPDFKNTTIEALVMSKGFPLETFETVTEDGYILLLHRIPHGRSGPSSKPRPICFFGVFLFGASIAFLMEPLERNWALIMADAGFDVWLGNVRGNTFGRRHKKMSPDDRDFWEFTAVEYSLIDLPTQMDFALKHTGQKQLYYLGFSQGTLLIPNLLAAKPQYNEKVRAAAMLGSMATLKHLTHVFLVTLGKIKFLIPKFLYFVTKGELFGQAAVVRSVGDLCKWIKPVCGFVMKTSQFGAINETRVPIYLKIYPAGTSVNNFMYFLQLRDGIWRYYDHGKSGNLKAYKSAEAPKFDGGNIRTAMKFYATKGDILTPCAEMDDIFERLTNVKDKQKTCNPSETFGHINFLLSEDPLTLEFFNDVIKFYNERPLNK